MSIMKITEKMRYLLLILLSVCLSVQAQENISLSGTWRFCLDQRDEGITNSWQNRLFTDAIILPGTTDEAKYGIKAIGAETGYLTREYKYIGPAWYQKDIEIPLSWKDKRIFLELERVMWESLVYVDDKQISKKDALNSAHWHDLGFLTPGKHQITVRINNDMIFNIGDKASAYTEHTQSIWNGAVGQVRLVAENRVRFSDPQIFTDVNPCILLIRDTIRNELSGKKSILFYCELSDRSTGEIIYKGKIEQNLIKGSNIFEYKTSLPSSVKLWNDIHPDLYILSISLMDDCNILDKKNIEIGFREISNSSSKILINGEPVFLRGDLNCVHFPLTGYPSCKASDWERIFRIYKSYGLNHVRFHTWCPPEAAFLAANRVGIYIQAETIWIDGWMSDTTDKRPTHFTKGHPAGLGKNPSAEIYSRNELSNMINSYGNNPSLIMVVIGNELGSSSFELMESWLKPYQQKDKRRLYSASTARRVTPSDQFIVTHNLPGVGATRGLQGGASTDWDFEQVYSKSSIPVIAHEIGQWPVYPNWSEIRKYKGVLKALNLEKFREQAEKNNIEEQNEDFVMASGALSQIMYKYETESFLRTPSCAGVQLLSVEDYQGQGEALVGWLDVFYDSKGITTPEKFRCHYDTTVALLRMGKFVWENRETFKAEIQIAHYGTQDFSDVVYWKITDEESNIVAKGTNGMRVFKRGTSEIAGTITCPLSGILKAKKLNIEVGMENNPVINNWQIWVYPSEQQASTGNVFITDRFDNVCIEKLKKGEKVLLQASASGKEGSFTPISFYPLYWSLTWFAGQGINTLGMLIKDKHPVFFEFPTDNHSDWQWESIYKNARGFYINDFPSYYKPMAQPINDFHENNKIAAIFELKAGNGKLLICGFDLKVGREQEAGPVARQLKCSILQYMNSAYFHPEYEHPIESLQELFEYTEPLK
jgi:beta-galactosidase